MIPTISRMRLGFLLPAFFALAAGLTYAPHAQAALSPLPGNECEIAVQGGTPGQTDCYGVAPNDYYFSPANQTPTPYIGARSNIGGLAAGAIDVWGICRYVDNKSTNAAFVPFSTQNEWQSFYKNAPQQTFGLVTCARALAVTITADNNCTSPTPPNQTYNLPYARTGTTEQATVDFTCGVGSPWAGEEVQVSYLALNSDKDNPDWSVTSTTYKQTGPSGSCAAQTVPGDDIMCPAGGPILPNIFNLPASSAGTTCTTTCDCQYHYYHVPYTCTNGNWVLGQERSNFCFLGDVTVTLVDGSTKVMTELKPGDVVRGKTRSNKIVSVPSRTNTRAIYGFNGGKAFVTGGHPFWTKSGWKAIDPALTPTEKHNVKTTKLLVGDELWLSDGKRLKITSIDAHDMGSQQVYSPVMDGDHTYYANGILVHNKPNPMPRCPDTGLVVTCP